MTTITAATTTQPRRSAASAAQRPDVEIVLPVHNEERVLERSVRVLHDYLTRQSSLRFQLTIADNGSTDATVEIAERLSHELGGLTVRHLDQRGRGRALRDAWSASDAAVLAYMDIDLSTDLAAFVPLVMPLLEGRGDLAIGSRLVPGSRVTRGLRREVLSRGYNVLLDVALGLGVADAQCGFKAGRREVIRALLPHVADEDWFFDTELLHEARRAGYAVRELPVRWQDDPDSRVRILATIGQDLRGIARLRRERRARTVSRNAAARRLHVVGR
jgi:glycosyltransferase involved in cell wall biosynthesis